MGTLAEYLADKGRALAERLVRIAKGEAKPVQLAASVSAEGRSGVRRIRIRDHQVLSDSPADFAGFDLGPSSPELQLGVLGSCVTHIVLIQAAQRNVPIDSVDVQVNGAIDPRGGRPGFEHIPVYPYDLRYTVHITSPAPHADVEALYEAVKFACPILNLLSLPQTVQGQLVHLLPGDRLPVEANVFIA